jgi:hypothetical protein
MVKEIPVEVNGVLHLRMEVPVLSTKEDQVEAFGKIIGTAPQWMGRLDVEEAFLKAMEGYAWPE